MLKKPWWEKRRKENAVDKTHYKNWCVIEVVEFKIKEKQQWNWLSSLTTVYKPCAKLNVPKAYDRDGKDRTVIVSDKLTKHEAHSVAKLLNTTQGELL
jgi:hypothetical protein